MDFKEIFDKTDTSIKNDFLLKILEKSSELREEFINKIDSIPVSNEKYIEDYNEFKNEIKSLYDEYKSMMESVDLENPNWEDYTPRHSGYIKDWEAEQHMAEDEADELFGFFNENITSLLLQHRIEDLFMELISFFYAAKDAEIDDPYYNLGDPPNEYFLDKLEGYLDYSIKKANITKIANERILNTIKLFFKYFENVKQNNLDDIKLFENLLVLLVNKIDSKKYISPLNKLTSIDTEHFPLLAINIEEKLGNDEAWINQAYQNLFSNTKIGEKLLHYYSHKDIKEYYVVATKLFNNDKTYWAKFLHDKIDRKIDKALYTNIFYQLIIDDRKIDHYNKIKGFLTTEDYGKLIETLNYDKSFLVEIYESDKKYEEIKQIVEQNSDSWDYEKLISPILNEYPLFCFENIQEKVTKSRETERGRDAYSRIASLLNLAKKITEYQSQTQELIMKLYNDKPNLPALKAEFSNAGLL